MPSVRMLLEGNSVSSVVRLTDVHQKTILKLLVLAGEKCEQFMGRKIRNVPVRDVQADELWSWIGCEEKVRKPHHDANFGDCYTYVAIETHTKLALNSGGGRAKIEMPPTVKAVVIFLHGNGCSRLASCTR